MGAWDDGLYRQPDNSSWIFCFTLSCSIHLFQHQHPQPTLLSPSPGWSSSIVLPAKAGNRRPLSARLNSPRPGCRERCAHARPLALVSPPASETLARVEGGPRAVNAQYAVALASDGPGWGNVAGIQVDGNRHGREAANVWRNPFPGWKRLRREAQTVDGGRGHRRGDVTLTFPPQRYYVSPDTHSLGTSWRTWRRRRTCVCVEPADGSD